MKKGKSRNKRKKTRSRLLWIAIAVIGIAAVISAVCVAGMLATKENAWKTPEELLVEYMDHIPKQEYEEMYAMLHIEASGNVSQEDFVTRNSAIYEGIEVQNIAVQIIAYDEEQMTVTYQTSFDTVAGTMEYLPITAEQIREYAVFDEENQTYLWARLGCFNYAPTFFGTSLPEVVDIKENQDGTVTLTVEAVCDMVICDDAVITHELTVRFAEDGSFQYLGNEILNDGIMHIPDYQYRIKE